MQRARQIQEMGNICFSGEGCRKGKEKEEKKGLSSFFFSSRFIDS
jgi:hypothetical protein